MFLGIKYLNIFVLENVLGSEISQIQNVPLNLNSTHFELFKPEIFICYTFIGLLLIVTYLRKFYRKDDLTMFTHISVIFVLYKLSTITESFLIINVLKSNFIIFNYGLIIDFYSIIIKIVIIYFTIILLCISLKQIIEVTKVDIIEYPLFILLSIFFLFLVISSYSMITLYLSIEGLSFLLYILTIYPFNKSSVEAAAKYYIMGCYSSGFLLLGIILLYGSTGFFDFLHLKLILDTGNIEFFSLFRYSAILSIIFGFLFKLGMFPFHIWSLDVYEGTWLPTTVFFMLVIKISIFFFFVRLLFYVFNGFLLYTKGILLISSMGSLLIGSIGSIFQEKLKRLFIYTSISQVGFCFLGLLVGTPEGIKCSFLFLFIYIIASLGVFVIILNTTGYISGKPLIYVSDLVNFGTYNTFYALFLSIFFLSMAGIPPLAGFFTKYLIFKLLIESSLYWLTIFTIIISVINGFIYIRLIKCLLFDNLKKKNLKKIKWLDIEEGLSSKKKFDFFFFDPGMYIYLYNFMDLSKYWYGRSTLLLIKRKFFFFISWVVSNLVVLIVGYFLIFKFNYSFDFFNFFFLLMAYGSYIV